MRTIIRTILLLLFALCPFSSFGQKIQHNWSHAFGDGEGEDDESYTMTTDKFGNVYVAGIFEGFIDFSTDTSKRKLLKTTNGDDGYIAKYDSLGNLFWVKQLESLSSVQINEIVLDDKGNVYVGGYYSNRIDFDPSTDTSYAYSGTINNANGFVAKYSNSGKFIWGQNIGGNGVDNVTCLALDQNNNVLIAGAFSDTVDFDPSASSNELIAPSFQDAFVAKYDSSGQHQWAFSISGSISDYAQKIELDSKGDIIVAGTYSDTADFDPSTSIANLIPNGRNDAFIAKYSASGNYKWAKSIGGSGSEYVYGMKISKSDFIYVTGTFEGTADFDPDTSSANLSSNGRKDIYFAKYGNDGSFVWANGIGTSSNELVNGLTLDADANVYITGYFVAQTDFDPSSSTANLTPNSGDIFIAKYDSSGVYDYALQIGDSEFENAYCIVANDFGSFWVGGYFVDILDFDPGSASRNLSTPDDRNASSFFARYRQQDGAYDTAWTVTDRVGGKDELFDIVHDSKGNIYTTGYFEGAVDFNPDAGIDELKSNGGYDVFVAKYSPTGQYLWALNLGGTLNDIGHGLSVDQHDNLFVTGYFSDTLDLDPSTSTNRVVSNGSTDIFLIKFDSTGTYRWGYGIGGPSTDVGYGVSSDSLNNVWLTGYFRSTVDFDPTSSSTSLTARNRDAFFTKFDASGNFKFAKFIGGNSNNFGYSMVNGTHNCVYLTGEFRNTCDFDPSSTTVNLSTSGTSDPYIAKYDSLGNYQWVKGINGGGYDRPHDLAIDEHENLYVVGQFQSSNDFDPSANMATLTAGGGDDAFVAKYDSSGNYQWAHGFGSNSSRYDRALGVDVEHGIVHISGYFGDTVDFNPSSTDSAILVAQNADNPFILRLDTTGAYVDAGHLNALRGYGYGITVYNNYTYVGGSFQRYADLDPGINTAYVTAAGDDDVFIAQYGSAPNCNPTYDTLSASVCGPYRSPNGNFYHTSGTYIDTLKNSEGCDSLITIHLVINNSFDTLDVTVCDSFMSPTGNVYFSSGTFMDTLTNAANCDSIITTRLTISNDTTLAKLTVCDSFVSYSGKQVYTQSGTYFDTLVNQFNCDSIIKIFLTVNQTAYNSITLNGCDSIVSPSGRHTYASSGVYTDTLSTTMGCDSIVTITATIYPSSLGKIKRTACDSFVSPSTRYTYNKSGTFYDTLNTANGCDSIIEIDLTIYKSTKSTVKTTACDSVVSPSGKYVYFASGTYMDTLTNTQGCDSFIILSVQINQSRTSKLKSSVCDSFVSPSGNYTYKKTGTYFDTIQTGTGCDSIIEIELTVQQSSFNSVRLISCDSLVSPSGRYVYTTSGNYSDTITNAQGCDSIIEIEVVINKSAYQIIRPTACDSFVFASSMKIYYTTGSYLDTLQTQYGCDSIIEIKLTIHKTTQVVLNYTSCDSFISPSGKFIYNKSGTYSDTLTNKAGCDSILTLNLEIHPSKKSIQNIITCDSFRSPNNRHVYRTSGVYSDTLFTTSGCDSVVTTNLTILHKGYRTIDTSHCDAILSPSGKHRYLTSGIYSDTVHTAQGCDSIITINFHRLQSSASTTSPEVCSSYPSPSGRYVLTTSGTYTDTLSNAVGCDSIITINLTVLEPVDSTIAVSACDSFLSPSGHKSYYQSGTYTDTLITDKGCDSIVIINLTIIDHKPTVSYVDGSLVCNLVGLSYQWFMCEDNWLLIDTATSITLKPQNDGEYTVVVFEENCADTATCLDIEVVGIQEKNIPYIEVYPNPFSETIHLVLGTEVEKIHTIRVTDTNGKLVTQIDQSSISESVVLRTEHLAKGMYYLSIEMNSNVLRYKVVKSN